MREYMTRPRVADALAVPKQRLPGLPGFPEPEARFVDAKGNVTVAWTREAVETWARASGHPVRWPGDPVPPPVSGGRPSPDALATAPLWEV